MFFDRSACDDGCGVGILLVSPRGATYSFSIRMATPCTNNLVEYEPPAGEPARLAYCNTQFIKEHKPSNHIRAKIKSHVYTTE